LLDTYSDAAAAMATPRTAKPATSGAGAVNAALGPPPFALSVAGGRPRPRRPFS
jgi:hypothetical protein